MKKALIILLMIFMAASGCSKKHAKAPDAAGAPGQEPKIESAGPEGIEEEFIEERIVPEEGEITETVITPEEEARSVFRDIHFEFDKYSIRPEARPVLDSIADFLYRNKKYNVVIEGHCDERGTNEYNLALGEQRAKSAQSYLASLGVLPSRIIIMTYGEEKPLCTEHDETCWQRNRRAHFVLVK